MEQEAVYFRENGIIKNSEVDIKEIVLSIKNHILKIF